MVHPPLYAHGQLFPVGMGTGGACVDGASLAQWVLVLVFLLPLCAPAQEQHSPGSLTQAAHTHAGERRCLVPALTLSGAELPFLPSLSRILLALQQPRSNQVAPGPVFLTSPFLFQV